MQLECCVHTCPNRSGFNLCGRIKLHPAEHLVLIFSHGVVSLFSIYDFECSSGIFHPSYLSYQVQNNESKTSLKVLFEVCDTLQFSGTVARCNIVFFFIMKGLIPIHIL